MQFFLFINCNIFWRAPPESLTLCRFGKALRYEMNNLRAISSAITGSLYDSSAQLSDWNKDERGAFIWFGKGTNQNQPSRVIGPKESGLAQQQHEKDPDGHSINMKRIRMGTAAT